MQDSENTENKAMTPGGAGDGVCRVCRGTKIVKKANGQEHTCYACRGTGKDTGKYATK